MDLPSLFLSIVLVSFTLAVAVGLVAERSQRDGMFLWAAGLVMHTVAYLLFSQRGQVPDLLSVVVANGLLSATFALFTESLCQFHDMRPRRLWIWLPLPLTLVVFTLLIHTVPARFLAGPVIFGAQVLGMLGLLAVTRRFTVGRSQYFVIAGTALLLLVLVVRGVATRQGALDRGDFGVGGLVQVLTYVMVLCSTLLCTLGFVLMGKERTDHRNRQLAMLDDLTGLPNRRCTLQTLVQQVAQVRRGGQPMTVLMMDVDRFKRINDLHGHLVGDAVLKHVAATLRGRLRGQDTLGRFGGEEFLAVLPATAAAQGGRVLAEALRAAVAEHPYVLHDGRTRPLSLSVGVAEMGPGPAMTQETLINAADLAMYRAKATGRNRVEVAQAADYEEAPPITAPVPLRDA